MTGPQPRRRRAYLSLGSNLGDRREMLETALSRLEESGRVQVVKRSSLYETEPVGKTDQPSFLNIAVEISTDLDPEALLNLSQTIERGLGRTREVRWGPRTVDIDILLYENLAVATRRLVIPHPEMIRRRFVLLPLLEIAPAAALPDGRRLDQMLAAVSGQEVRRVEAQ